MEGSTPARASERIARQVEAAVAAAETTAGQLRAEAAREAEALSAQAERYGAVIRERAGRDAEGEVEAARR